MLTREQLIANRNAELARRAYEGTPGPPGADGAAATITVGTVTTGAPGSDASVTNSGTSSAAVFDFTIPRGDIGATGPAPTGSGNAVLATPADGSSGTAALRALVAADIPDLSAAYAPKTQPWRASVWFPDAATGRTVEVTVGSSDYTITFAAGISAWRAKITTNPASTAVYSFRKNGTEFGTLSVATDGTKTWASTSGATIGDGDAFSILEPTDTTLANVNITAVGTR